MRRVPLSAAPLTYAAQAYPGEAIFELMAPVNLQWIFDQLHVFRFRHARRLSIDCGQRRITISRFDANLERLEVDLIGGSVALWMICSKEKRLQDTEVLRGSVPYVSSMARKYHNAVHLFVCLKFLWDHLCTVLREAHCATPRLVEVRGLRRGDRNRSVLKSEIWDHKPDWQENAVFARVREGDEESARERCSAVVVKYLGERSTPAAKAVVQRELAAYDLLLRMVSAASSRDLPLARDRRDELFSSMLEQVPRLRRREFERALCAATIAVRFQRQQEAKETRGGPEAVPRPPANGRKK